MSAAEPRDLVPLGPPGPGLARLRRRLAGREAFRDALLAGLAETPGTDGTPLGGRLDVAGDPTLVTIAELWARVADSVAAYTELTAGERYLGTAQDWTDLRRTTDLLGYRPSQRAAASGWIRCITDTGASPTVPAGTRVQAPGTPARAAQPFEVATDTPLRADWANLTVTGVPVPAAPPGRALRFLSDPGFTPPDRVMLVAEKPVNFVAAPSVWGQWLLWLSLVNAAVVADASNRQVLATVTVRARRDDLGAILVATDRRLNTLLTPAAGTAYAAYRVRATLDLARRLEQISYVSGTTAQTAAVTYPGEPSAIVSNQLLVVDASAASPGLGVIVSNASGAVVTTVTAVDGVDWSVAPGTKHRVGRITLAASLPSQLRQPDIAVTLVDERVVAQHYELPPLGAGQSRLRIHPRPALAPARIAVQTSDGWEMAACSEDAADTPADTGGMLLVLQTGFTGAAATAPATANLAAVRQGTTTRGPLVVAGSTAIVPGPVAADVDADGTVTDSLAVRVDGVVFDEVGTLYGRGPEEPVYASKLAADGRLVLTFGDGVRGAQPRGPVTAVWRQGGGLDGELDATLIDTLLGSVPGVRKVQGVGVTTGAADQEDPLRMRRAAAARIRSLDRAVSLSDLADLALTVPGTSHTAAWRGAGPPGCPCGASGVHVAALRLTATGVRAPAAAELQSLSRYLDARRDTTVGLCVCAGVASALAVSLTIATDPRRDGPAVCLAVTAALTDASGPLAVRPRDLGVPLDASDVVAVAQPVVGVVGIASLTVGVGVGAPSPGDLSIGRTPAARYELLAVGAVTVVSS
ncbi:MAG: baseplate J/gp47 family protein [Actinomycetota bacterium]|nr:baseplate J/gp47 family protein [Actinomycetota bacterium]